MEWGGKPRLRTIGPYVYHLKRKREPVVRKIEEREVKESDPSVLEYVETPHFEFDVNASKGTEVSPLECLYLLY